MPTGALRISAISCAGDLGIGLCTDPQALPYVASYSLFVLSLLLFDKLRIFDRDTSSRVAIGAAAYGWARNSDANAAGKFC